MEASGKKTFQLEHCWELLKESEKWKLIGKESPPKRGALTKIDDDDEDDDGPRNKNKADGNKKAKDKIKKEAEASSLRDNLDHMVKSNELLVIKTLEAKKELAEKKAKRSKRSDNYSRRRSCARNKAMAKLLPEENKIMMMNRNEMDEVTKEWHDIARLGSWRGEG